MGFYYEGWDPAGMPLKERHKEHFLAQIEEGFRSTEPVDAEWIATGVFVARASRVTAGEIEDIKGYARTDPRALASSIR